MAWRAWWVVGLWACGEAEVRRDPPDAGRPGRPDGGPLDGGLDLDAEAGLDRGAGGADPDRGAGDGALREDADGAGDAGGSGGAGGGPTLDAGRADRGAGGTQDADINADLGPGPAGPCARYAAPRSLGAVGDAALTEASGLALGRRDGAVLWSHNDSGDSARLFALSAADGRALGRVRLVGHEAVDLEDLAAADCPGQPGTPCLWAADVGDNRAAREDAAVLVVVEPSAPGAGQTVDAPVRHRIGVRYPGGPVDVEALLVAPAGDRLWLLEKGGDAEATRIFAVDGPFDGPPPAEPRRATVVGTFAAPGLPINLGRLVTGADLSPAGDRVLVRVYTGTWEYRLGPGQGVADLGAVVPELAALGPLSEPQGEAVGYAAGGRGFYTVSELSGGDPPVPLHFYDCR